MLFTIFPAIFIIYLAFTKKRPFFTKNRGFSGNVGKKVGKRVRDASIYASKKISLKYLFLSDIFLFPLIRQQVPILA